MITITVYNVYLGVQCLLPYYAILDPAADLVADPGLQGPADPGRGQGHLGGAHGQEAGLCVAGCINHNTVKTINNSVIVIHMYQ